MLPAPLTRLVATLTYTLVALPALGRDGSAEAFLTPEESQPNTAQTPLSRRELQRRGDRADSAREAELARKRWLLSLEGVTHAPVDIGVQAGAETPFGLHLFVGAGWIPGVYSNLLRNVAASASADTRTQAVLEQSNYGGNTFRVQLGIRPFKQAGLYLDGGYSRVNLRGTTDLSQADDPQLAALGGVYDANTSLDMWLIELGYLGQIEDRLVLGMALGVMGTLRSRTSLSRSDGGTESPLFSDIASRMDSAFESYGVVPTLTLRIGYDLL